MAKRVYPKRALIAHPTNPLWMLVPLAKGKGHALIDVGDADEVRKHNWCLAVIGGISYAAAWFPDYGRTMSLHRLITRLAGFGGCEMADHENHDGLDCRRSNIRPTTRTGNTQNARIRRDSTSGVKGVMWRKDSRKWRAEVKANGVRGNLGSFAELSDAERAVREARERLHAEFACHGNN